MQTRSLSHGMEQPVQPVQTRSLSHSMEQLNQQHSSSSPKRQIHNQSRVVSHNFEQQTTKQPSSPKKPIQHQPRALSQSCEPPQPLSHLVEQQTPTSPKKAQMKNMEPHTNAKKPQTGKQQMIFTSKKSTWDPAEVRSFSLCFPLFSFLFVFPVISIFLISSKDACLRKAVEENGAKNWKKIAESVQGRTDVQCLHRWQKVLNPNLVKGPWTDEVSILFYFFFYFFCIFFFCIFFSFVLFSLVFFSVFFPLFFRWQKVLNQI